MYRHLRPPDAIANVKLSKVAKHQRLNFDYFIYIHYAALTHDSRARLPVMTLPGY